jgi:hypothetical protein
MMAIIKLSFSRGRLSRPLPDTAQALAVAGKSRRAVVRSPRKSQRKQA